jgi:enoyl-CoA hydratase/carnithine racemase
MTDLDSGPTGPFSVTVADGVATVLFDRPPVNSVAYATYGHLEAVLERVEGDDAIRVMVLAAPEGARAWCGGADVNDFVEMNPERRKERYVVVNAAVQRLYAVQKPTIAAISAHAVGIGVLFAAACDLRIASDAAGFSCPEIDYGLVAGSAKLLNYLGVPEALVREMGFTGGRIPAGRMLAAGFLNDVVPRERVDARALELARTIAAKSMPALRARKRAYVEHEQLGWFDAYRLAQGLSAELVALGDSKEGVQAFLDNRAPVLGDR